MCVSSLIPSNDVFSSTGLDCCISLVLRKKYTLFELLVSGSGKIEDRRWDDRGRDDWMASLTQWTWQVLGFVIDGEAWHAAVHGSQRARHS